MAANIWHHLKLVGIIFRFWLSRFLQFRGEVLIWGFLSILWSVLAFVLIQIIFGQINSIAGWTRDEVLLLTGVHNIFTNFLWIFITPSILSYAGTIRDGKLDGYLLKPVNSRFLLSFAQFQFTNYLPLAVIAAFLVYLINQMHLFISVWSWLGFLALFAIGIFLVYCLYFFVATTCFWFTKIMNLEDFFEEIVSVGKLPTQIFNRPLLFAFSYIIPVAYVATFPVQFLLGRGNPALIFIGLLLCIIFFGISQKFWNFALKHYSSASS